MEAGFSGRTSESNSSRAVWKDFQTLLDKSSHAFNRLRDLPPYGGYNWEEHFHKAFHVYSQLWKFQQDHRPALTDHGLKRSEIGDIASKIGQLYYNYYLRTSETRFLNESYVFYEAIRSRQYFSQAVNDPALAIKQLRYFARFIIICLLLNNREEVWQLLQEYQALISSYIMKFTPGDAQEWRMVVQEVNTFMHADVTIPRPHAPAQPLPFKLQLRCSPSGPEARLQPHRQRLREAVLVSYYHKQVKIAELPLDSYRMLQALEWEIGSSAAPPGTPAGAPAAASAPSALASSLACMDVSETKGAAAGGLLDNPVKHLVYRPTTLQLLAHLTCVAETLNQENIMLIYLALNAKPSRPSSARAPSARTPTSEQQQASPSGAAQEDSSRGSFSSLLGAGSGSMKDNAGKGLHLGPSTRAGSRQEEAGNCYLLPEDLLPLTRRRVMLVVDSDLSSMFLRLQNQERGTHMMALLSPTARPPGIPEATASGNLLTTFLSVPLIGICEVCGVMEPGAPVLQRLEAALGQVLANWGAALAKELVQSSSRWAVAFQDALLRRLMLRFVLARALLQLHCSYGQEAAYQPACFPDLPACVAPGAAEVQRGVRQLAEVVGCGGVFRCVVANGVGARQSSSSEISPC